MADHSAVPTAAAKVDLLVFLMAEQLVAAMAALWAVHWADARADKWGLLMVVQKAVA